MRKGPGKYDAACEAAREMTGGTVLLIVYQGDKGNGFSLTTPNPRYIRLVPQLLREVADAIERET
jgi:hypothetical protein